MQVLTEIDPRICGQITHTTGISVVNTFRMDGYYQQFLTSMAGANNQTMAMSEAVGHSPISPTGIPSTLHNFSYLPGYPDLPTGGAKVPKGRRKSSSGIAGVDTVKHRRTRSGCFTCRSRRVKVRELLVLNMAAQSNTTYSATRPDLYVNVSNGRLPWINEIAKPN